MPKLGAVYLFNRSNCSHESLEVVIEKNGNHLFFDVCIVPFSLVLPLAVTVTYCHLLSLTIIRCHSLTVVVPLIVIFVTRCYSLSLVVPLVVTRCITSLSFYKRLIQSIKFATTYSLKTDVHKSQKCKRENL